MTFVIAIESEGAGKHSFEGIFITEEQLSIIISVEMNVGDEEEEKPDQTGQKGKAHMCVHLAQSAKGVG